MMQEWGWALVADAILVVHIAFVLFIVIGGVLIWLGGWRRWSWIRYRLFRQLHLAAMAFVLVETLLGMICPLTEWEAALRQRAGHDPYGDDTFMQYWLQRLLYQEWSHTTFIALYAFVFIAIVAAWFVYPPHKRKNGTRP